MFRSGGPVRAVFLALACFAFVACANSEFQPQSGPDGGDAGEGGAAGQGSGGAAGTSGSGSALGETCSTDSECASGSCADGVCCNSDCAGTCEACNVAGSEGTCSPQPSGSDPDKECAGEGVSECAGSCDGAGQCAFPGAETVCGTSSCTGQTQTAESCNGNGGCEEQTIDCSPFKCESTSCRTSCANDAECSADAYCGNDKLCKPKLDSGKACTTNPECKSGSCIDGVCCNTSSCAAPLSCATGACLCGTQSCDPGDACVKWYQDADGDGHGNPDSSILGCFSSAPAAKYVKNNDDCLDTNKDVFPGQTKFFTADRGDGKYDYDCSGKDEQQYGLVSGSCVDCGDYSTCPSVFHCGDTFLGSAKLDSMAFTCNTPGKQCGGPKVRSGFIASVACGQQGFLKTCGGGVNMCSTTPFSNYATQGCR